MTRSFHGLLGIGRYFIEGELRERGQRPRARRFVIERHGDLIALYLFPGVPGRSAFITALDPERVMTREGDTYVVKKKGYELRFPLPELQHAVRNV